ncbi:transcription elongation factor GreB, partial [Glaciimonas sp. CA11.2]|nr:transcription elongation factor GreB [Glaciimonas sp. CA11.2]
MNKAFVKESDGDDDDLEFGLPPIPAGTKNYMTPAG